MLKNKIGLVLSGGGAKGAYQVGVVRALAEMNIKIGAISGASIGALNGAIIASSPTLHEGALRLQQLWETIAENPPLDRKVPPLLRLMEAIGLSVKPTFKHGSMIAEEMRQNFFGALRAPDSNSLVDNSPIKKMLNEYVTQEQLAKGIPLFVSVFPSRTLLESIIGCSLARLGIKDSPESEFLHIQSLSGEEQQKALLASSAIPFLLQAQEIGGERYTDGGQGGLFNSQGNTPLAPLLENGCNRIIVTSLSDHSAWSKQEYPDADIIPIIRKYPINRNILIPEVLDVLCFQPDKIYSWIDEGYSDTLRCMKPLLAELDTEEHFVMLDRKKLNG